MNAPTPSQISTAQWIDKKVDKLIKKGGHEALLKEMHPLMLKFKPMLNTAQPGQMDALCLQYSWLLYFSQLLDAMAQAARDGKLKT